MKATNGKGGSKIRYAVVGLGYFAQSAILPAFEHARKNSELSLLVSDDPSKLSKLGKKYKVENQASYDDFESALKEADVDAVYIALPNSLHKEFTLRAANAGKHVLCEKPMAVTEQECKDMIRACNDANVKLMTGYRLHFEKGNLSAAETVRSGGLGEPRIFNSVFTMQVKDKDNIRLKSEMGGGPLYDIGIYCINAVRYLFAEEPIEVTAVTANNGEDRFSEVDEMASVIMRFPDERLATFVCSFGASDSGFYEVVGTTGKLRMDPAYESAEELKQEVTINGRKRQKAFPKRDQVAPEILYFSDCIMTGTDPEPSGMEGLIDVQIIRGIQESARSRRSIKLDLPQHDRYPDPDQEMQRPAVGKQDLINAEPPGAD